MDGDTEQTESQAILGFERRDLLDRLQEREAAHHRHTMWALIGVSPGALIPLVISMSQVGASVLAGSVFLMTAVEGWRALRAKRDVAELKETLRELRER